MDITKNKWGLFLVGSNYEKFILVLSLPIHSQLLCQSMAENALKYNGFPFPLSGLVIAKLYGLLVLKFYSFKS